VRVSQELLLDLMKSLAALEVGGSLIRKTVG